jgi:hypothetical protein
LHPSTFRTLTISISPHLTAFLPLTFFQWNKRVQRSSCSLNEANMLSEACTLLGDWCLRQLLAIKNVPKSFKSSQPNNHPHYQVFSFASTFLQF